MDSGGASEVWPRNRIRPEYAEILKESYWAQESSMDDVYDEARRLEDFLYRDNEMEEFVDLVKQAARLW